MDLDARITRRQRRSTDAALITDFEPLSPVAHITEPSDRGPAFERLLDHFSPAFDGALPPNAYLHGPPGAGKSAVVSALFARLARHATGDAVIHTSTRAGTPQPSTPASAMPAFVYVDRRTDTTPFAFSHAVLDALVSESVPTHGVSTAAIRDRLADAVAAHPTGVVVAVDHTTTAAPVAELLTALPDRARWLAVGRSEPSDAALTAHTDRDLRIDAYQRQTLVGVVTTRASLALGQHAFTQQHARRIAAWSDGNAHDALAALAVAAHAADSAGRSRLTDADIEAGIQDVPRGGVVLGRPLAVSDAKQRVLAALLDTDATHGSVTEAADAVTATPGVSLSQSTVTRLLYELSGDGIVERVRATTTDSAGRPPSRVAVRFAPTAFRRLRARA